MTAVPLSRETYLPDADVARVHDFLVAHPVGPGEETGDVPCVLIGVGLEDQVELPPAAFRVLRQVVEAMHQGMAVTVVPQSRTLTTQEAADLLGVSRPTVIKWLEDGAIPFERTGNRRRVLLQDVLTYRQQRRAQQYAALEALASKTAGVEEEDPEVVLEQLRAARKAVAARRRTAAGA